MATSYVVVSQRVEISKNDQKQSLSSMIDIQLSFTRSKHHTAPILVPSGISFVELTVLAGYVISHKSCSVRCLLREGILALELGRRHCTPNTEKDQNRRNTLYPCSKV